MSGVIESAEPAAHALPAEPFSDAGLERIKLMKFVTLFAIGGTERQVVNIGKGLDPRRFDLQFACLQRVGEFLAECDARSWSIAEYKVHSLYGYATFKKQMEFGRSLRRQGIQILHTYGFYPNVFAIPTARFAGVPVIIGSVRDTGDLWTPWQHKVQKICLRMADHIIVNAEAIKRDLLQRGYREDRVTVIPNGIDLERFRASHTGESVRLELNIPREAPVVGVLSRLMRIKGLEYFIEAAALIAARIPHVRFLIVGDTKIRQEYREELKRLVIKLGLQDKVIFTGFRLDVPELLAVLSVSVLPSIGSEGLSNSLLESMAAAVPVVATRVGGTPEIIEDGVSGLLVPPADAGALAGAICRLLEEKALAENVGQAGRRLILSRYSLDQAVATTERLYRDLLSCAQSRRWAFRGDPDKTARHKGYS
jgi:glycosyltransferase involved in cell wall biosynthesis